MINIDVIFIYTSLIVYFLSFVFILIGIIFKKDNSIKLSNSFLIFSIILHSISIILRWLKTSHPPVIEGYENALLGSWFVAIFCLFNTLKYKDLKKINLIGLLIIIFMLVYGLNSTTIHKPLPPAYQSPWLWVHVGFAWLAWGSFVISACTGLLMLMNLIVEKDEMMTRFILLGFICQGIVLISGALWASNLWGSYWSWDPIETWSLVCWLIYGLILHLRLTMKWEGKKFALISVLALSTAIIYFWGIGFVTSIHIRMLR